MSGSQTWEAAQTAPMRHEGVGERHGKAQRATERQSRGLHGERTQEGTREQGGHAGPRRRAQGSRAGAAEADHAAWRRGGGGARGSSRLPLPRRGAASTLCLRK